jgi:3-hydroxyisobutyrate dehydrogenase
MTTASPSPIPIAFLGLGVMGHPMASHLAKAGHEVRVFNRSPEKAHAWATENTGRACASVQEAARGTRFVFSCVGTDDDLRQVALGPGGALAAMAPGGVFVDHTTTSAIVAREVDAAAREGGRYFVDAPVSGGQAGAQRGQLTVLCGGEEQAVERARPLLASYAKAVTWIGGSGAGQVAKMVNQLCIAGLLQGLSEGIHLGQSAGLDMKKVLAAISQGAAQSWQMENRGSTMVEDRFDFGFAVRWMRKDLGICLAEARRSGASLPVAALIDQFYAEIEAMGGTHWDTSSLVRRLRRAGDR